jgi:hypothetical protein
MVSQAPGQQTNAASSDATAERVAESSVREVQFSGVLQDGAGAPLTGVQGVTFALYAEQTGGAPLWLETQNVTADAQGHYSVLLGSQRSDGLPQDLFSSNQARWLGVSVNGVEQPRVLLVSVPYALKAADAETLGGKPVSAFVLAPAADKSNSAAKSATDTLPSAGVTTQNFVQKSTDGAGTPGDSLIFDNGNLLGVGTTTPSAALDIELNNGSFLLGGAGTHSFAMQGALSNGRFGQDSGSVFFASDTAGKDFRFLTSNGTLNEWMRITSGGFVGIGTALPGSTLDIEQNSASLIIGGAGTHSLALQGPSSNGRFGQDSEGVFFASDTNGKVFKFLTNNGTLNESMRVTSAGNVGIGTNAPSQKLDMNGTVNATAFTGNGSGLTSLNASNLSSGTVANARTTAVATSTANTIVLRDGSGNFAAGTVTAANFVGDGSGLTNVPAGTTSNVSCAACIDSTKVDASIALTSQLTPVATATSNLTSAITVQQNATSSNIIMGYTGVNGNAVTPGIVGAAIGGGGSVPGVIEGPNLVTDNFGTIGGGSRNQAGLADASTTGQTYATVGGGWTNVASGNASTVSRGKAAPPADRTPPWQGVAVTSRAGLARPSAGASTTSPAAMCPPSPAAACQKTRTGAIPPAVMPHSLAAAKSTKPVRKAPRSAAATPILPTASTRL